MRQIPSISGQFVAIHGEVHHILGWAHFFRNIRPSFITIWGTNGTGDGQFDVVWETDDLVPGDAWSNYLEGSKDLISDWRSPVNCGNFNVETETCAGGQSN